MSEEKAEYRVTPKFMGEHLTLNPPELDLDLCSYRASVVAKVIDIHESAIYEAIVEEAKRAGISDLYLIDKQFVITALQEKIDRETRVKGERL